MRVCKYQNCTDWCTFEALLSRADKWIFCTVSLTVQSVYNLGSLTRFCLIRLDSTGGNKAEADTETSYQSPSPPLGAEAILFPFF